MAEPRALEKKNGYKSGDTRNQVCVPSRKCHNYELELVSP